MAFASGNIGKEVLQNALNRAMTRAMPKSSNKGNNPAEQARIEYDEKNFVEQANNAHIHQMLLPFEVAASEKHKCSCHVCQEKRGIKVKPAILGPGVKGKTTFSEGNEKGFSYLLRILIPDKGNAPKGLKFLIADTLVFNSGEPRFLLYNSRDKYIRFIRNKDKLAQREMRKFFQERKKRKEVDGVNFFNENTITMQRKIKQANEKAKIEHGRATSSQTDINGNGNGSVVLDEKRGYRTDGMSPTRKEKKVLETTAHKEIVICKYTDTSMQVMSELDFSYLMMKRKLEAVWTQFDYIQTYIKLSKDHPYFIKVDFDFERDTKNPLYERARHFIYYLAEEREPELEGFDYASEEDHFEENLKANDIYEYCQYVNFKFVCYLDAYCASRVKYMISEYAWEDTGLVYLVNAHRIRFFNLDEIDDYVLKEVDIVNDEERQKALDKLNTNKGSPYQGKVEVLWAFRQYYDDIKKDMGINKDFDDSILENPQSNEAFKQMNPETAFTLFDVLTDGKQFELFKIWLQNRSTEPGKLANLFKSALKYAESNAGLINSNNTKTSKPKTVTQDREKKSIKDDSEKAFLRKFKALEICGNGASRKKYINSVEVLYKTDVYSGRKLISQSSTRHSKSNNTLGFDSTTMGGLKSPNNETASMNMTGPNKFKIRSFRATPQPQSTFDMTILSKNKSSLGSILYLKPNTSYQ
jgi:hypothetical protein